MGESKGIGSAGVRTSAPKPSQLSLTLLQSSTSSTILSQSFASLLLIATILLYFLVWETSCHILPRHATTGPLLAGWVSIKWRGLTPRLHHKQGWISIKWRGLTPTCTITLLLCGREQRNWISRGQNQHSEAISALTLLQSSTSSTILSQSFTSLLLIATIILYFLVWATSCHILPHLATTCHDWALAGRWVSIKWRGLTPHLHHKQGWISIKWRGLTPTCTITLLLCGREQRNWSSRGHNQHSEAISALTLLQSSAFSAILSHLCYHPS